MDMKRLAQRLITTWRTAKTTAWQDRSKTPGLLPEIPPADFIKADADSLRRALRLLMAVDARDQAAFAVTVAECCRCPECVESVLAVLAGWLAQALQDSNAPHWRDRMVELLAALIPAGSRK